MIVNPTTSWSAPLTLTEDTAFYVNEGAVLLSFDETEPADPEDGLLRRAGEGLHVATGNTVRYKLSGVSSAVLWYGRLPTS